MKRFIFNIIKKFRKSKGNLMQEYLQKEIQSIFGDYESFVIAIKGDWGSGKTYFWNEFRETYLTDVQYAYVSLFGKESIEDIKRDVILQISLKDKHLTTVKDKVSNIKTSLGLKDDDTNFGITGAAIGSIMSLFEKKDFDNVVVCLDDFERRSENLDIKEVLGYLSILKEQFNCKIVLILNEEKISDEEKVYKDYKEKIVDFEYTFVPSVEECYKVVKKDLNNYQDIFLSYCKSIGLNNIRIMKRVIRLLNKTNDELKDKKYRDLTIENFINEIFFFSIANYKFGFNQFNELEKYLVSKRMKEYDQEEVFTFDAEFEEVINYMNLSSYFYVDAVDRVIMKYLETSVLDVDMLREELDKLDENHEDEKIKDEFFNLEQGFIYDLGSVPSEYVDKVYTFLHKHRDKIFRLTSFGNYMFFLKQIIELDKENEPKYQELLKETAYQFVDYLVSLDEEAHSKYKDINTNVHILEQFKEDIPGINEYIDKQIQKKKSGSYNCDKLLQVIKSIDEKSGWGIRDEEFLNYATKEFYEQCLMKPKILEQITSFLRHDGSRPSFAMAKETILNVLTEIEAKDINGNGYKIRRIKYLTGDREDEK